jgi:hypothetical protein
MRWFFIKWILIGLVLRLVLMPFTVHPDITSLDLGAFLISQKGELLTFYDYLSRLDPANLLVKIYGVGLFNYPPLAYLVPAGFMAILGPLYNFAFNNVFLLDMEKVYQTTELFKLLLLLKFPYLLFDFLLAYLLFLTFQNKGQTAFKLWMINPFTLYATFAMGQFDIMPTLLVIAAIFFATRQRKLLAVSMLGIGGAFKLFPLLFLPIFALVLEKRFWHRIKLLIIGSVPYLVIIAPYFLFSPMYRQVAFLAGQAEKMLYMKLPLSGAEYLSVFGFGYFGLLFLATRSANQKEILWRLGLALMLLLFSVTHYHPQWFLWITPFLIWDWLNYGKKHLGYIAILLICYIAILLFFEPTLHIGLFAPIAPDLLKVGSLADLVGRFYDVFLIKSLLRTLFAATAAYLIYLEFRYDKVKRIG